MENLTSQKNDLKQLCVCRNKKDAFSIKNTIQSVSSIHVSLREKDKFSFIIEIKKSNLEKALTIINNNDNIMNTMRPLILVPNSLSDKKVNKSDKITA